MASRILRLPTVLLRTGLSRSTVYARVAKGTFPRQLSLGPNTVGWRETDIDTWIDGLTATRTAEGWRAKPVRGHAA